MLEIDENQRISTLQLAMLVNAQEILIDSKIFDLFNGLIEKKIIKKN